MFNSDKPIEIVEDDLLGRANFAKQLGKALINFENKENIIVGMYGKWGTGKTSIINMALKELMLLTSSWEDDVKPIIIKFEPWNFTNNENLITQYFYLLREKINRKENIALKNSIGDALEQYSDALEFASVIPFIGPLSLILKLTMIFAGKQIKKKYANKSIDSAKESLIKILKEQNKKIVVIIDDIDRLSNEQIRMIFQLVKQVACFPNTTYLLSMDKDVVCRALGEIQQYSGEDYLEKIIQIPFNIPALNKDKVNRVLFHKLDEILKSNPDIDFDKEHWSKVYQGCVAPYIQTIRDVNRVMNSFRFRYDMIYSEVNFADLIGITTLEVLKPEILEWIIENKQMLCGGTYDNTGVVWSEQDKKKEEYIDNFKRNNIGSEISVQAVASLFPKFDKEINHYYESVSENDLRGKSRIAHNERFDLYFKLDINEIKVNRQMIADYIHRLDEEELDRLIKTVNADGNAITFLEELRGKLDEVPYNRIGLILRVLYRNKSQLSGTKSMSLLSFSADWYAELCITQLIEKLATTEERYNIFIQIVSNANISVLSSICKDINSIEIAYGRLAGKEVNESGQLISLDELERIETAYSNRLKELAEEDHIFETESLSFVKYLWEKFDLEECRRYFDSKLRDDRFKLKFICSMAEYWYGTHGQGWSFTKSKYNDYVEENELYEIIDAYDKGNMFKEFTELEILKLAFFVLNKGMNEMQHASELDAKVLMKKWQNQ